MKRRDFVRNLALVSAGTPVLLNDMNVQSIGKKLFSVSKSNEDRILVIIRMNGGNDGLNTVIPRDQYSNLTIQRNNVLIPENDVLELTTEVGLHPKMTGMKSMYDSGSLGIIQSVGYAEQNRSHFRSMDIWSSGLINSQPDTGWLGRYFDGEYPGYPIGYPSAPCPDPFAISLGYEVSATCQGIMANFCHAVEDPFDVYNLSSGGATNDGTYYGDHMEYLTTLINQANAYGQQVNDAANNGTASDAALYDLTNPLSKQLRYVAQMIDGGLQTNVYILNVNGFDTHNEQVSATSTQEGSHADLLERISEAVASFQADLEQMNHNERVAGMTFSEFGRQVASNASLGTDHGDAAPMFLFGSCLNTNIMGVNPTIGNTIVNQAGIDLQYDFRDIYASILKDWFGVPESEIQTFFEHTVQYYPILGACNIGIEEEALTVAKAIVYPNPANTNAKIRFVAENEWVKVDIFDLQHRIVQRVYDGNLTQGEHNVPMQIEDLPAGEYIVQIKKESGLVHSKLLKVK